VFGIGIMELVLIFSVALIVLGPKQLPDVARTLGGWFYRIKNVADSARQEIEKSLDIVKDNQQDIEKNGHG